MLYFKNGHACSPISVVFSGLGGIAHKPRFKDSVVRKFWSSPYDSSVWIQALWKSISLCSPYWQNTTIQLCTVGVPPPPFIEWKTYNTFTLIFHLQHFVNLFLPIENKEISLSVQNTIWCNRHCKKDKVKDIDLNSKSADFFLSTWGSITHLFNMMIQSH